MTLILSAASNFAPTRDRWTTLDGVEIFGTWNVEQDDESSSIFLDGTRYPLANLSQDDVDYVAAEREKRGIELPEKRETPSASKIQF